jgi:hypothetical protein
LHEAEATRAGTLAGDAALDGALGVAGGRTVFLVFTLVVIVIAALSGAGPQRRTAKVLFYAFPLPELAGELSGHPAEVRRDASSAVSQFEFPFPGRERRCPDPDAIGRSGQREG